MPEYTIRAVEEAWELETDQQSLSGADAFNTNVVIVHARLGNGKTVRIGAPDHLVNGFHGEYLEPAFRVYFIQAGERGPIKIGIAVDPEKRLKELQTGCAERLRVLTSVPGGYKSESALHRLFRDTRLVGEWFKPTPELLEYIASLSENA